ncbi:tRNA (adenosine(37)-N6)-threonylcarbamoyltransferase complex dimerization subunit type 1 TsaB [Aliifodinibius sp. S!AR15-10]|uniref:tRNA (adenosine(37)-N6)-threonylcarbamoyltransferase complex dimerization subunit type 1 TsaB n=1 Tax=Aliifodinibius sp. S!AR15-10 TaxID=2950437 RepID=UPI002860DBF0|nr:tRNA (adenosine(37)-N6)-threonylcarbamoyltransferase complex dimerization subunit type 1 TsaB [Aliifodinibius sp. S!AR15-10]MDR8389744.1 tRNA (adenosine(37)-N6)-threonylcarbamoyltransferase complex dimerization subunit type 1 TsaB [Aliifodinibius sp. S!AR15-10]
MLLALETATNVCSVAFKDEEGNIFEKRTEKRGSHSEQLFLFVEKLMQEQNFAIQDLEAVLVSEGPGSYTGLRISASAVKGLLFQTEVPLYGINTLASFAMQAVEENPDADNIHSIIDARRVHVYHQKFSFSDDRLSSNDNVEVIPIEAFESMVRSGDTIIGTGLNRISESIKQKAVIFGQKFITSSSLIRVFRGEGSDFYKKVDPESFDPKYYTSNQV